MRPLRSLGLSRDVIFRLLASGELKSFKAGRARLISAEALREFIRRNSEEPA